MSEDKQEIAEKKEGKKGSSKLEKLLNVLSSASVMIMVVLVFWNAILRYFFKSGLTSAEELSRFVFVWLSFLGIILAAKDGSHVSVTLVIDTLKGGTLKAFKFIKNIIVLLTMLVVLYGGVLFTISSNYKTAATGTNFMFVSGAIVISSFAVIVYTIINLFKDLKNKDTNGKEGK